MSTFSSLKFELILTGDQSGQWGNTTNTNIGTAINEAIAGSVDITFASADLTLTLTDTNATQSARNLRLNLTGTAGGSARTLTLGSGCQINKPYIVNNGLANAVTVKNTTGTGIAVPAGATMWLFNNGTNVVDAVSYLSSLTLGTALAATSGGTGQNTYAVGDLLYASSTSALTRLAAGTAGQLLQTNGAAAPSWVNAPATGVTSFSAGTTGLTPSTGTTGAVTLAGTLAVANGGTGVTSSTGTGSVVLSVTPTFTGTVLNNIGTFAANVYPGPNGTDVVSTETGITLKYSTPFVSTGAVTKAHYAFVSSPTVTNTGASGTQGLEVSGVASFPNIISSGASTVAQVGYGGYFQFNRTNAADLGRVSTMYGVYGAALISGSFGGTSSSLYGGRFLGSQQVGTASGFIVGVRGTANLQTVASTMMAGVYSDVTCGQSTTLTQPIAYNFYGEASIGSSGSGTIVCTNFYGLYLKSPTIAFGASITNEWGVYQQSTTAKNYFGGGATIQGLTVGKGNNAIASNTAFGVSALLNANSSSSGNTAIGNEAGKENLGGSDNIYMGQYAGRDNQSGNANVFIGNGAGVVSTSGGSNTAVGYLALGQSASGYYNVAVGHQAGYYGSGDYNTAVGQNSGGSTGYTGSNLTLLGFNAQPSTSSVSNQITLGDAFVSSLRCNVTTITALSDARDKYDIEDLPIGLDFINSLRPRRFKWDRRDHYFDNLENEDGTTTQVAVPKDGSRKSDEWNEGFIAQEVDEAATAAGADWMNLVYKSNPEKLEMTPGKLIPVLVKAIQELTARLEALEARN